MILTFDEVKAMSDFLAYADGMNDLFDISNLIHVPVVFGKIGVVQKGMKV